MLIVFGGLPGTGKSTIARALAARLRGVYLRIDRIEQAIRQSGIVTGDLADAGYRAAYALAEDNLRLGRDVVADSVNPIEATRRAWRDCAARAGARSLEVEILCTDKTEHRRRVESRVVDIDALMAPSWKDVAARTYEPWTGAALHLDTARMSAEACVEAIAAALREA